MTNQYEFIEVTYDSNGLHKSAPIIVTEDWMEEYLAKRLTGTRSIQRSPLDGSVLLHRMFRLEALFTPIK